MIVTFVRKKWIIEKTEKVILAKKKSQRDNPKMQYLLMSKSSKFFCMSTICNLQSMEEDEVNDKYFDEWH